LRGDKKRISVTLSAGMQVDRRRGDSADATFIERVGRVAEASVATNDVRLAQAADSEDNSKRDSRYETYNDTDPLMRAY